MQKERWNKYKREMKKLGFTDVAYTYSLKQQKKRTATILIGLVTDPEEETRIIKEKLANRDQLLKQAQEDARYAFNYMKRNRSVYDTLFIPAAKRDIAAGKPHAEEYLKHCLDSCDHYDDGTFLEWKTVMELHDTIDRLNQRLETLKSATPRKTQVEKVETLFNKIKSAFPTQDLLSEIGGDLVIDYKGGIRDEVHARFLF